jgi:hypothetical protein
MTRPTALDTKFTKITMFAKSRVERHSSRSSWPLWSLSIAVAVIGVAVPAFAQPGPTGYVSILFDHVPNRQATELRARGFAEEKIDVGAHLRLTASGFVEGLLADRDGRVTDAIAEPQDLNVAWLTRRIALTAGLGRVVWGRLDELQPTDVVNPIDVSRFFFEGRSEARLGVPLVHAKVYAGDNASIEGIYVPVFRRGRFDRLAEASSPFNLAPSGVPSADLTPGAGDGQGGARVNVTSGRVDWSVSAYRGFRPFGIFAVNPSTGPGSPPGLARIYPRFTMFGGDFETVAGPWVVRGEVAAFVRDVFQAPDQPIALPGRSYDAGAAVDRKAGEYRISGQVLVHREAHDAAEVPDRTDVSLIVSADRSFARQKYQGRLFGVYNPNNRSGFLRGIATASLRDNVALEGSAGWFAGTGLDTIGRFADSDFLYLRLKYFF